WLELGRAIWGALLLGHGWLELRRGGNVIRRDFILQHRCRLRVELDLAELRARGLEPFEHASRGAGVEPIDETRGLDFERGIRLGDNRLDQTFDDRRSEEHTSELQSPDHL